jgi:uncharacterized protein
MMVLPLVLNRNVYGKKPAIFIPFAFLIQLFPTNRNLLFFDPEGGATAADRQKRGACRQNLRCRETLVLCFLNRLATASDWLYIQAMKIEIQHIPDQGMALSYQRDAQVFSSLMDLARTEGYEFVSPIFIDLHIQPEHDMFSVKGGLAFTLRVLCSRCLASFEVAPKQRFTLRFSRKIPQDVHAGNVEGVALTADEIGLAFFEGDSIDLRDAVQEQVVLAVPLYPVCRENCKGLCPRCGVDLNVETCRCTADKPPGPFDVLKNLKLDEP